MPDLTPFHREFVFLHVLGVFLFLFAHGISAGVIFWVRRERDRAALRSLLSLSYRAVLVMAVGALLILLTGILAGFSGDYWTTGRLWLWASLGVFVVVFVLMTPLARTPLDRIREALDEPTSDPPTLGSVVDVAPASLEAAIAATRPMLVTALGVGAVIVLTWLMMYKPF